MAYTPTPWKDRQVQKPNTFTIQNNPDGTVTLIPVPGTITQAGTPTSAANLNKIESAVKDHDDKISNMGNATPKPYATLAALQAAFPTGAIGVYVVAADGKWYYWSGTAWEPGGVYQASSFTDDQLYDALGLPNPQPNTLVKNEVVNGNFASTSGWSGHSATISAASNTLSVLGTGTAPYPQFSRTTAMPYGNAHKIYFKAKYRVTNAVCTKILFFMTASGMTTILGDPKNTPADGVYYTDSKILTTAPGGSGNITIYMAHYYADAASSNGKIMEVQNYIVIDLTARFGAGNEPTAAQMDALLAAYAPTTLWFDGTQSIPSIGSSNGKVLAEINGVMKMAAPSEYLTAAQIPIADTIGYYTVDNVEGALIEAYDNTAKVSKPSVNSFDIIKNYNNVQDLIPLISGSWGYTTSTFNGWGGAIGAPSNFDTLVFKFRNRAVNTLPITSIRAGVTVGSKGGAILADRTITGLNILPGEEKTLYFDLGVKVSNAALSKLWAMFECNRTIDVWFGQTTLSLNAPDYGVTAYSVDLALLPFAAATAVYDANLDNKGKPMLYTASSFDIWSPKAEFLANLPGYTPPVSVVEAIKVNLPPYIHAVIGDTLEVFYNGVVGVIDVMKYNINFIAAKGNRYKNRWIYTPLAGDTDFVITIDVYNMENVKVGTGTTTVKVNTVKASPSTAKNVLCIGDSLSGGGVWQTELQRRLCGVAGSPAGKALANINFIGTCGTAPTRYEGYGGWTFASYLAAPTSPLTANIWVNVTSGMKTDVLSEQSIWKDTNNNQWQLETRDTTGNRLKFKHYPAGGSYAMPTTGSLTFISGGGNTTAIGYSGTTPEGGNPFWNSALGRNDFIDYCAKNAFGGIDFVYILLGWNEIGSKSFLASNHASTEANAKSLIDRIHLDYPTAKIVLMGLQAPSFDGLGANYGSDSDTWNYFFCLQSVFGLNDMYKGIAANASYSGFVNFANVASQFDNINNMSLGTRAVNVRSSTTESYGTNGVHPATPGYYQIADICYRDMMSKL